MDKKKYFVKIDLKPALDEVQLDKRLLRDFEESLNRDFANSLDKLLPKSIIPVIINMSGINPHTKINQISREERQSLINAIKQDLPNLHSNMFLLIRIMDIVNNYAELHLHSNMFLLILGRPLWC